MHRRLIKPLSNFKEVTFWFHPERQYNAAFASPFLLFFGSPVRNCSLQSGWYCSSLYDPWAFRACPSVLVVSLNINVPPSFYYPLSHPSADLKLESVPIARP